ncbi:hypothetical protein FHS27_005398 [Rhodopirellula rubra]|uniref:Uncharacterized protein n=1 Tax=Aporhodopirellula rubra TaxID=980271 RepID=A0A7W5H8K1_9BACT|nr:hypothetical protein [Aporhodopirellula rubra]
MKTATRNKMASRVGIKTPRRQPHDAAQSAAGIA